MRGWWRTLRGCAASGSVLPPMCRLVTRRIGAEASVGSTKQVAVDEAAANQSLERKLLRVGVLGVPNAGKSTLINHLVGGKVTAVSTKTNTTRGEVIGVLTKDDTQILFYDTPGVVGPEHYHNPDHERKVKSAWATASFCDLLLLLVDAERQVYRPDHRVDELISLFPSQEVGLPDRPRPPSVLVLNKMDLFPVDERKLVLPLLEKFQQEKAFDEVFLVSALKHRGTDPIMQYLMDKAKPGQWLVPPGKKTTSTVPVRALEIVRGHLYKHLHKEMPYRIDLRPVSIRYFADGSVRIEQEIVVKHRSQRQIVVGRKGAKIGQIGIAARKDLQANLGQKVHLILNVVLRSDKK